MVAPRRSAADPCHIIGNGDVFSYTDWASHVGPKRYEHMLNHMYRSEHYRPKKILIDPVDNLVTLLPHSPPASDGMA